MTAASAQGRSGRSTAGEGKAELARYLVALATTGERTTWSEFAETTAACFAPTREGADAKHHWRAARPRVLETLAALGLAAAVLRTDAETTLADHYSDLAGLVRVHHVHSWFDNDKYGEPATGTLGRYAERMRVEHGLFLADQRIPCNVRAFCGQRATSDWASRPPWVDHVHSWLDADSLPLLSLEPTTIQDPVELVRRINAYVVDERLPLRVVGPHAGVWSERSFLVRLEYDADAAPLPAEHVLATVYGWLEPELEPTLLGGGWRPLRSHRVGGATVLRNARNDVIPMGYITRDGRAVGLPWNGQVDEEALVRSRAEYAAKMAAYEAPADES